MILKDLVDEDFVNYKKPNMFIIFPHCSFKCDKEYGTTICQNCALVQAPNIEMSISDIIKRYQKNDITQSIVCGGLEPLDSFPDVLELLREFRKISDDDFVIYTGYNKDEVADYITRLKGFTNVIVKFGRYIPDQNHHFDDVLGITLASSNQYAERIS